MSNRMPRRRRLRVVFPVAALVLTAVISGTPEPVSANESNRPAITVYSSNDGFECMIMTMPSNGGFGSVFVC